MAPWRGIKKPRGAGAPPGARQFPPVCSLTRGEPYVHRRTCLSNQVYSQPPRLIHVSRRNPLEPARSARAGGTSPSGSGAAVWLWVDGPSIYLRRHRAASDEQTARIPWQLDGVPRRDLPAPTCNRDGTSRLCRTVFSHMPGSERPLAIETHKYYVKWRPAIFLFPGGKRAG